MTLPICTEVKEKGIDDDTLFVLEIHYSSGDEENNTVLDDIDILEHKMILMNHAVIELKVVIICGFWYKYKVYNEHR